MRPVKNTIELKGEVEGYLTAYLIEEANDRWRYLYNMFRNPNTIWYTTTADSTYPIICHYPRRP